MKVQVVVTLKPAVLDPQGKAVAHSLKQLGYEEVSKARVGKYIELDVAGEDPKAVGQRVEEMCAKLLCNPVIEDVRYEFAG